MVLNKLKVASIVTSATRYPHGMSTLSLMTVKEIRVPGVSPSVQPRSPANGKSSCCHAITISAVRRLINSLNVLFDACYRGSSGRLLVRWRAMKCCRYSCCHIIATLPTKCWALTDWCCRRWCKMDTSWWQTLCWISTTSLCR